MRDKLEEFIESIKALPEADRNEMLAFMRGIMAARKLNDRA